jgi:hypothetical protein
MSLMDNHTNPKKTMDRSMRKNADAKARSDAVEAELKKLEVTFEELEEEIRNRNVPSTCRRK